MSGQRAWKSSQKRNLTAAATEMHATDRRAPAATKRLKKRQSSRTITCAQRYSKSWSTPSTTCCKTSWLGYEISRYYNITCIISFGLAILGSLRLDLGRRVLGLQKQLGPVQAQHTFTATTAADWLAKFPHQRQSRDEEHDAAHVRVNLKINHQVRWTAQSPAA